MKDPDEDIEKQLADHPETARRLVSNLRLWVGVAAVLLIIMGAITLLSGR
jgi:hypothetical protein